MNSALHKNIASSSTLRTSREENAQLVLVNANLFPSLLELALNIDNKNHHKACWILQVVLEKKLHFAIDYLPFFCLNLSKFTNESALRSISKICMFSSQHLHLSNTQEQQIMESCFEWLIDEDLKVATKVYALRTLFELVKKKIGFILN
jgi:hypothetical protein